MADYEDQNSSEYKDMNQETQAADPNPHSAGNVPQAPDPAQPDQQNPPQNNGQDPYWHNPQNGQPIPPQNNGQDHTGRVRTTVSKSRLRILDRIHTGRISRTADSSHRRTGSRRIGKISTITDSRPTGRTSRSARDAKRTPSRRSP